MQQYDAVGGQAVLGRQQWAPTPWLPERHGYDPTYAGKIAGVEVERIINEPTAAA